MKKLILAILCVLCLSFQVGAYDPVFEQIIQGSGCDQIKTPTEDGASAGPRFIGGDDPEVYVATEFVYTGTTTQICKVDTWNSYNGTQGYNYYLAFYSDDGEPNVPITNGIAIVKFLDDSLGGDEVVVSWTFTTPPTLTNGVTYWLVMYTEQVDYGDYLEWHYESSGTTEHIVKDGDGLGTWTSQTTTSTCKFRLLSK